MEKSKKKFKDTRVGKFLSKAAPNILKEEALKLLEMDIIEMQEVSKRWSSDMSSDSWLSKNVRPMMLIFLTVSTWLLILMDSLNIDFGVDTEWIGLLKSLLITVFISYYGSRGIEKYQYISKK